MSIKQPHADLFIQTKQGQLTIDQTQAWEDMNLMSIKRRIEQIAQKGLNAVQEGMARRAQQGTQLMKIEHGGQPIREQAVINASRPTKSLSIHFIPSPLSVKIGYIPSKLHIAAETKKPEIDAIANRPQHIYEPGNIDIKIAQYEQLEIDFVNVFSEYI